MATHAVFTAADDRSFQSFTIGDVGGQTVVFDFAVDLSACLRQLYERFGDK